MSVYIWLPIVFLSVIVLWITLYAYGKKRTTRQQNRRRNVTYLQSSHLDANRINTQIYTIPTRQMVGQQVPMSQTQTTTTVYNGNNGFRTSDAPPSYDQAIVGATAPDITACKTNYNEKYRC